MASLSSLQRIADQITALEARQAKPWRTAFVERSVFSDDAAVLARHNQIFPEDEDANLVIWKTAYPPDVEGSDTRKVSIAWRQLAREEIAKYPRSELQRLWGLRAIKRALKYAENKPHEHRFCAVDVGAAVTEFSFPDSEAMALMRAAGFDLSDSDLLQSYERGKGRGNEPFWWQAEGGSCQTN